MDNRIIKEIKKDNISVKISLDSWTESPRTFYTNIGNIICYGKHKNIGNDHNYENIDEFFIDLLDFPHMEIINYCLKNKFKYFTIEKKQQDTYWIKTYDKDNNIKEVYKYESDETDYVVDLIKDNIQNTEIKSFLESKEWIILPIYMYDHSCQTIKTTPFSCKWDSGLIGYIYASDKSYNNEGLTKEKAIKVLENEIVELNDYLNGNVYIGDLHKDGESIECTGNYYPCNYDSFKNMVEEMLSNLSLRNLLEEGEIVYDV